jgi:hypothetical protein
MIKIPRKVINSKELYNFSPNFAIINFSISKINRAWKRVSYSFKFFAVEALL